LAGLSVGPKAKVFVSASGFNRRPVTKSASDSIPADIKSKLATNQWGEPNVWRKKTKPAETKIRNCTWWRSQREPRAEEIKAGLQYLSETATGGGGQSV